MNPTHIGVADVDVYDRNSEVQFVHGKLRCGIHLNMINNASRH